MPLLSGTPEITVSEEFSEAVGALKSVCFRMHLLLVKQAVNEHLYRWREFPVELPPSILDVSVGY